MSEWKVVLTPEAQQDIRDIHSYIADTLLEPVIASNQTQRIINAIKSLCDMPLRFPLYEKKPWHSRGLRKMPVDNYLVFYFPNEKQMETVIFRVFYGGRNLEELLPKK